jgi:4-hydroxythreonine-4-phosphate dehydrogenase
MSKAQSLPIAVTMGDPAGIGGDVMLGAWSRRDDLAPQQPLPTFFAIDDPARLSALARRLGLDVPVQVIDHPAQAMDVFHRSLPVLSQPVVESVVPGQANPANASAVIASIERAVALVQQGEASSMVTLPINKRVLHQAGFGHPGHTEFLATLSGGSEATALQPVMMLACSALKVVPVTIHLSVADAVRSLTSEAIVHAGTVVAEALRAYFGRPSPRLAVAALNPHAGEGGDMGREEIDIIAPAIATLRALGIDAFGPAPADTLFHPGARDGYDACLCMYHDQALIPIKTIDFHNGVNVTLGLPFIRTSPDHGTAYGLAGSGEANDSSFIASLRMAQEMVIRRHRSQSAALRAGVSA